MGKNPSVQTLGEREESLIKISQTGNNNVMFFWWEIARFGLT